MEEGASGKNHGSIVILKVWVAIYLICLILDEQYTGFSSGVFLHPDCRKNEEDKTYPAEDICQSWWCKFNLSKRTEFINCDCLLKQEFIKFIEILIYTYL